MNSFIISTAWEWQWSDFVISIIGTLLGFIFAILATWGANKWIESTQRKEVVKLIKEDLKLLNDKKLQSETLDRIKSGNDMNHSILSLPHLERLVATNQLILISKQKWFNEIMKLFSTMNEINIWYDKKSNFYFDNLLKVQPIDGREQNTDESITYRALCITIAAETENKFYTQIPKILKSMEEK